jgi:cytochrome c553
MKKILLTILGLSLFSVNLFSYDQAERVKDMQTMAAAMTEIQTGLLSNDTKMVLIGVEELKSASANVEIEPKSTMDYSSGYAKKQSKNIMKYAEKIKKDILSGHKHSAAKNYTNVLGECISCHNKIRKWN